MKLLRLSPAVVLALGLAGPAAVLADASGVEQVLIETGHARMAKAYILYRERRARAREQVSVHGVSGGGPLVGNPAKARVTDWSKARIADALVRALERGGARQVLLHPLPALVEGAGGMADGQAEVHLESAVDPDGLVDRGVGDGFVDPGVGGGFVDLGVGDPGLPVLESR